MKLALQTSYFLFLLLRIVQLTYISRATDPIGISLIQDETGSPIFAIDIYFWLSVSTIFLGLSLGNNRDPFLKKMLYFHGITGSTCIVVPALPMIYEKDSEGEEDTVWQYVLLFWCAQFAPICFLLSKNFCSFQGKKKRA